LEEFDTSGLIQEYVDDAREHLEKLDSTLLEIEKESGHGLDVELVSDLLGALHTLKGNSGMMGYESLQKYVHELESVFKSLLEGKNGLDEAFLQTLFEAAGAIREALEQIERDPKAQPDLTVQKQVIAGLAAKGATGQTKAPVSPQKADSFKYIAEKSNILKVDFERLDHLLNLAGELVIHRTKLSQVEKKFKELRTEKELAAELTEANFLIQKAVTELQEAIMKVRMLPVRHVFQRFPRMVRDLARERGKEIEIIFKGESTELDKTVIDEIGEPLLHLIRNSIDHGIEMPDERVRKSKSPVGEIMLSAAQEGNNIIITVSDNGAGIDVDSVRAKAAHMYTEESLESMAENNVLDLIFEPGFSTAREVTQISGRGVGLDVVRKSVSNLGGIVEVSSQRGTGTIFTIKLPLTLAIISALLVKGGDELYALLLSSVIESLRLEQSELQTVNNREVIMLRDRVLPLVRLSELFNIEQTRDLGRLYVVVLGRAEKKVGLVVDSLMGRQEIVIKALGDYVGESAGIAGATILGDGSVVLILDVAGLIEKNMLKADKRSTIYKEVT
jgi:two-component system, chemotaxis family, sensor kinase CheA